MTALKSRDMRLVVFDLDRTLLRGNSSFSFCYYLVIKKILPWSALFSACAYRFRHYLFHLGLREMHQGLFQSFLKGMSLQLLQTQVDLFLEKYLPKQWYFPALFQLRGGQQLGDVVVILSNSPAFLVEKIVKELHVELWRATEYQVDREGKLCHIATVMGGEEKAVAMQQIAQEFSIPLTNVVAYSDSITDLPLLQLAGRAVGVNPDRELRAVCQRQGWEIL